MYAFAISGDSISGGGFKRGQRSAGLRPGFSPVGIALRLSWTDSSKGATEYRLNWQAGGMGRYESTLAWQYADRAASVQSLRWQGSPAAAYQLSLCWQSAPQGEQCERLHWLGAHRGDATINMAWKHAFAGAAGFGLPWLGSSRGASTLQPHWGHGRTAGSRMALVWGPGTQAGRYFRLPWQRAGRPSLGIIIVPPDEGGGGGSGGGGGGGGGVDPFGSWRIFLRSSYQMLHDISLVRLPERTPIEASKLSFTASADSPHILFRGTVHGREALDALIPSGEDSIELEASIDGWVVRLVLDPPKANQAFASNQFSISGRSLSWYLGMPYQLPRDKTSASASTAQQLAEAELPPALDWSLTWTHDWPVPAGALSYRNFSPLQAIQRIAAAAGHIVVPSRTAKSLAIKPRYPVAPWDFASATPALIVPAASAYMLEKRYERPVYANSIYLAGGAVGGVLARLKKSGTAGDRLLAQVQDDLICDVDAAYWRGIRELAGQWQQPLVKTFQLPLDNASFPLAEISQLVRIDDEMDGTILGSVSSVTWGAEIRPVGGGKAECRVSQSITLGEDTSDPLSLFKALAPAEPLIYGTVSSVSGSSLVISLPGGGILRARGEATVGAHVYIKDGRVDSPAPNLGASFFDLEA